MTELGDYSIDFERMECFRRKDIGEPEEELNDAVRSDYRLVRPMMHLNGLMYVGNFTSWHPGVSWCYMGKDAKDAKRYYDLDISWHMEKIFGFDCP